MHHLLLLASISCFVAILIFGFLDLLRELLTRNFFDAPSLPNAPPEQSRALERESESRSATPLSCPAPRRPDSPADLIRPPGQAARGLAGRTAERLVHRDRSRVCRRFGLGQFVFRLQKRTLRIEQHEKIDAAFTVLNLGQLCG